MIMKFKWMNNRTYHRQENFSRADYLLMGIVLLICSLFFVFVCISFFRNQYEDLTYDETKFMELTYESYDKIGAQINIKVIEFEEPIYISTIVSSFLRNDIDTLNQKQYGSKIEVYLIKASRKKYKYEIVEFKFMNEDAILTLQDYNKAHLENNKLGLILLPAFTVGSIIGCAFSFNKYQKMKRNNIW